MKHQLITRNYNDMAFTFRDDGYFNMTKAAKHFSKRLDHFMASPETKEYIAAFNSVNSTELIDPRPGRYGGTWAHPKLSVPFARWLDVRFAVWCDSMIEDILKGKAEVVITKPT